MRTQWSPGVAPAVVALAVHGVAALRAGDGFLRIPIEGGGLLFGPVFGLPLLGYGVCALGVAAVLLVSRRAARGPALSTLGVAAFADVFLLLSGAHVALLGLGAVLALGGFVTLVPMSQWTDE